MSSVQHQSTVAAHGAAAPPSDFLVDIVSGRLGRDLGLSTEDLRVGLVVAKNLIARGKAAEALRLYATLVLCAPAEAEFQLGLSNCASIVGEHYIALQAASAVIALAPSDPRGYLISGRSCLQIGSIAEAEQDLADALRFATEAGDESIGREATLLLDRIAATRS